MNCDCPRQRNGVLQFVHQRLGTVVDTREGADVDPPCIFATYFLTYISPLHIIRVLRGCFAAGDEHSP